MSTAQLGADLALLASVPAAGRLSGTAGARFAADHLAVSLAELELAPAAGEDFRMPVQVPAARLDATPTLLIGGKPLRHRRDFAESASESAGGRASGPLRVVEASQSVPAAALGGAVLLVPDTPAGFDARGTAEQAAQLGAAAMLYEAGSPHSFYKTVHSGGGRIPVLRLQRALARRFKGFEGAEVSIDLPLAHEPRTCHNVVGRMRGSRPGWTLALTAHYDHVGDDPGGMRFPGAFDNASGVAVLLEVARIFATRGRQPPCDLLYAFLTGEESGLFGARALLASSPLPISAVVNVDSAGIPDEPVGLRLGHAAPGDSLAMLAGELLARHGFAPRWIPARDDSVVFADAGLATVGVGQQIDRPGLNPMHTPLDMPERLDLQQLGRLSAAIVDLVDNFSLQPGQLE
jgi:hypothetical protein